MPKGVYPRPPRPSVDLEAKRLKQKQANERFLASHPNSTADRRTRSRAEIDQLLGVVCACCGSADDLQIDHKIPTTVTRQKRFQGISLLPAVRKNPQAFQRLCRSCNRWKDSGPCCPCQWWDKIEPDWRRNVIK